MKVKDLAKEIPNTLLWLQGVNTFSFKSLKEPVKMVICLSTLSWGWIANFVFKILFQQKPQQFLN